MTTIKKVWIAWVIVPMLAAIIPFINGCKDEIIQEQDFSTIESGFITIPDSVQTGTYWYWLSDNISKDGVIKDLEAMKKVGINRAFIGNIGLNETPYGKVKIFTDEWWDILHAALKKATELNIEIGIFNSPGWSQSGGPWIKSRQSMRYLNSSELAVTGPVLFNRKLVIPDPDFQQVKVIAYKTPADYGKGLKDYSPEIISDPVLPDIKRVMDGDVSTFVTLQNNRSLTVDFRTEEPVMVRSLLIQPGMNPLKARGELFIMDEDKYISLAAFNIDRSNPGLVVGFDPYAPIVITIPETKSKLFRLVISDPNPAGTIAEIDLSGTPLVERYPEKSLAKMFQTPLPYWHEYMWPAQPEVKDKSLVIDPQSVLDITDKVAADGTLTWDVPEGNWIIMQAGMTTTGVINEPATPEGTGLEADKMSKEHIAYHFDAYLGEILRRIPAEDRKTWKIVVEDSYERGGQNWTDGFIEDFSARYGYGPVPYIPVLKGYVVGSLTESDRFLWDLRRMVADKIAWDYVGGLRDISHKNGLTTWLENYGHWGFPGEFLQYGGQSDEIGGEFWSEGDLGNIENRAASSSAHIYGKRKVSAESFTCAGAPFSRAPVNLKQRGDRFFAEGINNSLLHVYIHQPDEVAPGVNAWFGNEFNRHNSWFNHMDLFISYLKRTNFMLQQGTYVADVAYFIGEDAPKMTGICDPELPPGYSFDYINSEVIMSRLTVENGKLMLPDGMSYRILVLPKLETMRPELLAKIDELVRQGAVVLGPAPKYSPSLQNYPACDEQVQQIASELWGDVDGVMVKRKRRGQGMIISGTTMQEALDLINVVPDCKFQKGDPALFIHRKLKDGDIYFITNQSDKQITISPEFRVAGRSPEFWDAVSGSRRDLPAYTVKEETTIVPLKLQPSESAFIIFRKKGGEPVAATADLNFPEKHLITELSGPWTVEYEKSKRGPLKPVVLSELTSWPESSNDSIKYYSGTARYETKFSLGQPDLTGKLYIDMGIVNVMAKVKLNGNYVGGVWTAPWSIDISSAARVGDNTLEVEVVNTWVNRLIGDSKLPVSKRKTWCYVNPFKPGDALAPSGLVGPVRIVTDKQVIM